MQLTKNEIAVCRTLGLTEAQFVASRSRRAAFTTPTAHSSVEDVCKVLGISQKEFNNAGVARNGAGFLYTEYKKDTAAGGDSDLIARYPSAMAAIAAVDDTDANAAPNSIEGRAQKIRMMIGELESMMS